MRNIISYTGLFLSIIFSVLSCSNDDINKDIEVEYAGEHKLSIESIEISGFGSIKTTGIFNVTSDPTIIDIGFMLYKDNDIVDKISLDKNDFLSKESVVFGKLESGQYKVISYIENAKGKTVSSPKEILLNVDKEAEIFLSTYSYDYETENGEFITTRNNGDNLSINILSKIRLIPSQMQLVLGDKVISSAVIDENTGWTDGYYHCNFWLKITDEVPNGKNEIKLNLDNNMKLFSTNLFLDKSEGSWRQLNSLFTGDLKLGLKISFQNEKFGFLAQKDPFFYQTNEFQLWRIDFSTLKWTQMTSLKLPANTNIFEAYPTQITIGNKAYIILRSVYDDLGLSNSGIYNMDIWEYNMDTNIWKLKAKFNNAFPYNLIVFAHNNKFHIIGGSYPDQHTDTPVSSKKQWIYDPGNNSLSEKEVSYNLKYNNGFDYSTFESPNYTYIVSSGNNWNYEIVRYSEKTNTVENVKSPYLKISRLGVGYYHNGQIYYIGGSTNDNLGSHKYAYRYSEKDNTWQQIKDFPYPLSSGVTYQFNNQMYVGLGGFYDAKVSLFYLE